MMMAYISKQARLAHLGLLGTLLAGAAHAQQPVALPSATKPAEAANVPVTGDATAAPSDGLSEIVVTAQRRSEKLQNVPIAVTVISGDTLAATGVHGTTDLALVTPSLNIVTSAGGYILPRIRGVGTSAAGPGIENPVATYIDGIYISSATGAMTSLANIAQVAVLKGPQGTLFGRNATGGLIQITTKDPTQDLSGTISATYGNHDTIGANAYVAGGLTNGIATDLALYYNNQRDGFGTNLVTGRDVNKARDFAARSKTVLQLGESTTAKLIFDYSNTRGANPAYRPVTGTVPVGGVPFRAGKFDVSSNIDPFYTTRQGGVGLTLQHDFESVQLVSITGYRRTKFHALFDNDKTPAQITATDLTQKDRQFSQELQLQSNAAGPFKWTLGAFYFDARGDYDPLLVLQNPKSVFIRIIDQQSVKSIAGYGQGTYELAPGLNLTAGLRYTSEKRSFDGSQSRVTPAAAILLAAGSDDTRVKRVTWRLSADYRLSDEALGYVSYNRGFKSAGYNPQSFPPVPFQPEQLDAYEVGLKTDLFDRRVRLNGALFYYDYKNIQVSAFRNGVLTIFNAAAAKIYGIDVDTTARVTRDFTVTGGLSVLHDRYKSFPGAQRSTPLAAGGNAIGTLDAKGSRLIQTPDWTLNFSADYTIPLGPNALRLNGTFYHNDGWYPEAENRVRQSAYNLVNASATFVIADGRYTVMAWGRNLGNVAYAAQMNSQAVGDAISMAAGRTFGGTVGVKF